MKLSILTFIFASGTLSYAEPSKSTCDAQIQQLEKWAEVSAKHWGAFHRNLSDGSKTSLQQLESTIASFNSDKLALDRIQTNDPGAQEIKKLLSAFVNKFSAAANMVRDITLEHRGPKAEEGKRVLDLQRVAVRAGQAADRAMKIFKSISCRNPAGNDAASTAKLRTWAKTFRNTTGQMDQVIDSLNAAKPNPASFKQLDQLANYWRSSVAYTSSPGQNLSVQSSQAKALYAEEVRLMIEVAGIIQKAKDGSITDADIKRLDEAGSLAKILGHIADILNKA